MKIAFGTIALLFGTTYAGKTRRASKRPAFWVTEKEDAVNSKAFFEQEGFAFFARTLKVGSMSFSMDTNPTPVPSTPLPTTEPTFAPTAPLFTGDSTPESTNEPTLAIQTPTPSPESSTTPLPTRIPTTNPTQAPEEDPAPLLSECETSYVHCGDSASNCFIGGVLEAKGGGPGPWGWNVDLAALNLTNDNSVECNVYAGAAQCDYESKGILVGSFTISANSVDWKFLDGVGGSEFHFYAGKCEANDGGAHLVNGGFCEADEIAARARVPGSYPLKVDGIAPLLPVFGFDTSNHNSSLFRKQPWSVQNYLVFPLTNPDRMWMSAHATVCPCAGCVTDDVASVQNDRETIDGDATQDSFQPLATGALVGAMAILVAAALFALNRRGTRVVAYDSLEDPFHDISLSDESTDIEI